MVKDERKVEIGRRGGLTTQKKIRDTKSYNERLIEGLEAQTEKLEIIISNMKTLLSHKFHLILFFFGLSKKRSFF